MQTPEIERRLMLGLKPHAMNNNHRRTRITDRMWAILIFLVGLALLVLAFTPNH